MTTSFRTLFNPLFSDSPQIQIKDSLIHSPIGRSVQIDCFVHSEPSANVIWFSRNGRILPNDNFRFGRNNQTATLTIEHVMPDSYDNYTCVANNTLGSSHATVEVTGKPSKAEFTSPSLIGRKSTYDIEWSVESESPITAFDLYVRRVQHFEDSTQWKRFRIEPEVDEKSSKSTKRTQSFRLNDLIVNDNYEANVVSFNTFGSTKSNVFAFITSSAQKSSSFCLVFTFIAFAFKAL